MVPVAVPGGGDGRSGGRKGRAVVLFARVRAVVTRTPHLLADWTSFDKRSLNRYMDATIIQRHSYSRRL